MRLALLCRATALGLSLSAASVSFSQAPPAPKISTIVNQGDLTTINGTAQPDAAGKYTPDKVVICLSSTEPKAPLPDCTTAPPAGINAAKLHFNNGTVNTADYVTPDAKGAFVAVVDAALTAGSYVYVQETPTPKGGAAALVPAILASADSTQVPTPFQRRAPIFAAVAGLDISGASSTDSQPVFHASAIFDVPLTNKKDWISSSRFWVGGQLRIAGMAQPGTLKGNLGDVTSLGSYLATAVNATPDKIVQSIEVSTDVAIQWHKWETSIDSLDAGTDDGTAKQNSTIITISALGNVGALTPLSAAEANPPVYNVNTSIYSQYGPSASSVTALSTNLPSSCDPATTTTPCLVTFVPLDRNRFYRHYEGGLRLKMYGRDFTDHEYRPPALADVTIGGNEYVTGGKFASPVLHVGGWVPIPKVDAIYIFGSMDLALERNSDSQPLILEPSTAGKPYSDASVHQIFVQQPDRDRYMFGFGVDLYHLIGKISFNK